MQGLKHRLQQLWSLLREAGSEFSDDQGPLLGASVAFYSVLSLSPLLLMLVVAAGIAYGQDQARQHMTEWIEREVGGTASQAVIQWLQGASAPGATTLGGLLSFALLGWGATRLFSNIQDALNLIWEVHPKQMPLLQMVRQVVRKRVLTFALLGSLALLFIVSVLLDVWLGSLGELLAKIPGWTYLQRLVSLLVSSVIFGTGIGLVYKILPDVRIPWRVVWKGAFWTGALLVVGKLVFGLYIARQGLESAYGAAGSVVALLVWVYFSAQVFFFGAELTEVYARRLGVQLEPEEHAERIAHAAAPEPPAPPLGSSPPVVPPKRPDWGESNLAS